MSTKRQSFMEGALILIVAGFLVKVIGAVFKIPLYNIIGAQANAYFTVAYDIYTWMYILTTSGLPVAISRMVSESNAVGRYGNSRRILSVAFSAFFVLGIAGSAVLWFGADTLAALMNNENAAMAIRIIAPAIMFEIVMSSYRGYFQGYQNMVPTAVSQIIVALAKLGGGIAVAKYILSLGLPEKELLPLLAAGAISGVTLGTVLGSLYLVVRRRMAAPALPGGIVASDALESRKHILRRLVAITVPIAIGSSVMSVTNLVDTSVVLDRLLAAGFSQTDAEIMFGAYSGMARTLFNLPTALIIPIGIAVIPAIAQRFSVGDRAASSGILGSALRLAILMALPAGLGLSFMSKPILDLLYPARPEDAVMVAPLLSMLGIAVMFVCLVSITNAILQAIGREQVPVFTILVGGCVKVVTNFTLVGRPDVNIYGAPVGTNLCYFIIMALNLLYIRKTLGHLPHVMGFTAKALGASLVACAGARLLYDYAAVGMGGRLATVLGIAFAGVVYVGIVLITKAMRREDVILLPKGEKIAQILEKRNWMV
ncbi:MAG TPA: polysaccharide biosynthesis protein [Terriglobales bacterium]|nr:polysaccharide biosynthesis protein [Terriglobales bacterium]